MRADPDPTAGQTDSGVVAQGQGDIDADDSGPSRQTRQTLAAWRDVLLIVSLSVFGLYFGSDFLIPLALAILLFVLIIAVSDRVRASWPMQFAVPVWLANLIGMAVVLSGVFAVMYVLASQARHFTLAVPSYEAELAIAATRIATLIGNDFARVLKDMLIDIDMSMVAITAFGGARSFLSTFLLVFLYVVFMLAGRATIARNIERAAGHSRIGRDLPGVMQQISRSLQRYVGVKTFISVLTASISYAVFRYLDLEFAETWAVLTFALNFIPFVGSIVAVLFPAAVSLVQFDTITPFLIIFFGCGLLQVLIGNFLDPALLGRSLKLPTLMVVLALTFWSTVWGVIGAFLSVPLTVCLLIVFSHVPATRPLAILMTLGGTLTHGAVKGTKK